MLQRALVALFLQGVLTTTVLAAPAPSLDAAAFALRPGESTAITLSPALPLDWTATWSATGGTVTPAPDGASATFTAGPARGYATVTAEFVTDTGEALPPRHVAILVYKRFAIIKADDYVVIGGEADPLWKAYTEYMNRERRLKHSIGVITKFLEGWEPPLAAVGTEEMKAMAESGLGEFWLHGYDHSGNPLAVPPESEFANKSAAQQQVRFQLAQDLAAAVLGMPYTAFGAPFGLTDANTPPALDNVPTLRTWLDGRAGSTKYVINLNGGLVEAPTGRPRRQLLVSNWNASRRYTMIQIHPNYRDELGDPLFQPNFGQYVQILDYLEQQESDFILPEELRLLDEEGLFPLHPDDDQDGDGVSDWDEGQRDADQDGLPDFLDADDFGRRGVQVGLLQVQPVTANDVTIDYALYNDEAGDVLVALEFSADGAPFQALSGASGDLGSVAPGPERSVGWDYASDLPIAAESEVVLRWSLNDVAPALPLITVGADTFPQGCATCAIDDAQPVHTVTLDAFEMGETEITNAQLVEVLNWALAEGLLNDALGNPYGAGIVYHNRQPLFAPDAVEGGIEFSTTFTVVTRDSINLSAYPAVGITWYGAVAFCNWRSTMDGLTPAYDLDTWRLRVPRTNGYRLPTEAEWERAAAWNGVDTHYTYGYGSDTLSPASANYGGANPDAFTATPYLAIANYGGTAPSGGYGFTGNAAEWVNDRIGDYGAAPLNNPLGDEFNGERVVRGGAWDDSTEETLATWARAKALPNLLSDRIGFRVARSPEAAYILSPAFTVDRVAPTLDAVDLLNAPPADAEEIGVGFTFSEPVTGFALEDITLDVVGETEAPVALLALEGGPATYTVRVSTTIVDGTVTLGFLDAGAPVQDSFYNTAPISALTAEHTAATLAPALRTIALLGAPPPGAASVNFVVTFSKPVNDVVPEDFEVVLDAVADIDPTVSGVSGTGTTWTVSLDAGRYEGMLGLALTDADDSIRDSGDRPLRQRGGSGLVHTVDTLPPAVVALALAGSPAPNAAALTFALSLSEAPATALTASDFTIEATGTVETAPSIAAVNGAGTAWTITVNTGIVDGTITLAVDPLNQSIADAAGNALTDIGGPAGATVDTIAPEISLWTALGEIEPGVFAARIEFSEATTPPAPNDFAVAAMGEVVLAPEVSSATPDAGGYIVRVTVNTVDGEVTLSLDDADTSIADLAGNPLDPSNASPLSQFFDTIAPAVTEIALVGTPATNAATLDFSVRFSEPVSGVDPAQFSVLSTGRIDAAPSVQAVEGSDDFYTVTVATGVVEAALGLRFENVGDAVVDAAGNAATGAEGVALIIIDTAAPGPPSFSLLGTPAANAAEVTIAVEFGEAVEGVTAARFFIEGEGRVDTPPSVASVTGSGANYTVTIDTGALEGALRLRFNNAQNEVIDEADNPAMPGAADFQVFLDTRPPSVQFVPLSAALIGGGDARFHFVFSETIVNEGGNDALSIGLDPSVSYENAALLQANNDSEFFVTISGIAGDGTLAVGLADDAVITDVAGNPLATPLPEPVAVVVDQTPPDVLCQDVILETTPEQGLPPLDPALLDAGSTDLHDPLAFSADILDFTCADRRTPVTVTLTVTDALGNAASCTAQVEVLDTAALCGVQGAPQALALGLQEFFASADTNRDGKLSEAEVLGIYAEALSEDFDLIDTNGDGLLNVAELLEAAAERLLHSADQNGDRKVALPELLRGIQFFNIGAHHCAAQAGATVDGYQPGTGSQGCIPHASDFQVVDWRISLQELLRLIQFFNLGGYYACPDAGTADGFCGGIPAP